MSARQLSPRVAPLADRAAEKVRCRTVRARLPAEILNTWPLSPASRRHLNECLACQAQAARYNSVIRTLSSLKDELEEAPVWLVSHVMAVVAQASVRQSRSRAGVYVAASAVVASAAAAGAVLWVLRGRVAIGA